MSEEPSSTSYSVTCTFLGGSDAQGCRFILVGSGNAPNISDFIHRHSGNRATTRVSIPRIGDYSTIVASVLGDNNDTCDTYHYTSFPLMLEEASENNLCFGKAQ